MRILNTTIAICLSSLIFISCGGEKQEKNDTKKAKGNVAYGSVFKLNEVSNFRSLYPPNITETVGHRIGGQIYEGLVKLDQNNLEVIPSIAKSWEINDSATVFTFHLNKNVRFHNNACFPNNIGREVTATDVKYCIEKACENDPSNQMFWLFKNKLVGANEFHNKEVKDVSGIEIIDDYTISFKLNYPFAGFLKLLAHNAAWIYPKEMVDKFGDATRVNCVGTGPFMQKVIQEDEVVILERNPHYWRNDQFGNQLPYLDGIKISFIKEKKAEIFEFRKRNLDFVFRLPLEMIKEVVGELEDAKKTKNSAGFYMQVSPALSVYYYGFQHKLPPFDNINVRKAFNYAIDRKSIVKYTLQGDGKPGNNGIVPPYQGYPSEDVKGYSFDPTKAKNLLSLAGYPNGNGFPEMTLHINAGGGVRNEQTAQVIQKMLQENLNIKVNIEVTQFSQHLENLETGKALFWRTAWIADYPDPENFLNLLYGKHVPEKLNERSYINSVRYQDANYDLLFENALQEIDEKKRFMLYAKADQLAMDNAAIMPIFYDENTRLLQDYVKNFPSNAMEYRDFSEVYIHKKTK